MGLKIYCYDKKDFGFQDLLIARMIGIENAVQNTLSKDRTYGN